MKDQDKIQKQLAEEIEELRSKVSQLEKENEKYQLILENTSDSIVITTFDLKAKYLYVSPSSKQVLDYEQAELLGKSFFDFVHPEDKKRMLPILKNYISLKTKDLLTGSRSTVKESLEFRFRNKAGQWREMQSTVNIAGKNLLAVTRDITDRKNIVKKLHYNKRKLDTIFNSTNDLQVLFECEPKNTFRVAAVNRAYLKTLDLMGIDIAEDKLIGKTLAEIAQEIFFLEKPEITKLKQNYIDAFKTKEKLEYVENTKITGHNYFAEITLSPILNEANDCNYILYNSHDISKLNEQEKSLQKSEEMLRTSEKISGIGCWELDLLNHKTTWSDNYYSLLGYDQDRPDASEELFLKHVFSEDLDFVNRSIRESIEQKGSKPVEFRFVTKNGAVRNARSQTSFQLDENGSICKVFGIFQDITEWKKAKTELEKSEGKFRSLFENINAGVALHEIILDEAGKPVDFKFLDVNPVYEKLTTLKKENVVGKRGLEVIPDLEQKWIDLYGEVALTGKSVSIVDHSDFLDKYWDVKAYSPGKNLFAVALSDITSRIKAEDELKDSKLFNETLLNTSTDIIYIYDIVANKNIYSNEGLKKVLGYSIDEIKAMGDKVISNLMHPDDFKIYLSETYPRYKHIKDGESISHEYRMKHKNGTWLWLRSRESIFLRNFDGLPQQIFGMVSDITESKKAKQELIEAKETAERYLDIAGSMFVSLNANGEIILINQKGLDILEYNNRDELIGKNWFDTFIPSEIVSEIKQVFNKVMTGDLQGVEHFENEILTRSGKRKIISWYNTHIRNIDGKIICLLSSGIDVTKQKASAAEIIENDRLLRNSQRIAKIGSWNMDLIKDEVSWSKEALEMYGRSLEEGVPSEDEWKNLIHKDDWDRLEHHLIQVKAGKTNYDIEFRIVRIDNGEVRYIHSLGELVIEDDIPVRLIGVDQDVTERRLAEEELLQSEMMLDASQKIARVGGWEFDVITQNIFWTKETYRIHDFDPDQFPKGLQDHISKSVECYAPEDREIIKKAFNDCVEKGIEYDLEVPFTSAKGKKLWVRTSAIPVYENNKIIKINGTLQDITDRKNSEVEIRDSEERFRELVNTINSGVAIYEVINDGKSGSDYIIQEFNDYSVKHEQLEKKDVIGKSLKDIRPNIDEYGLIEVFRKVWKSGEPTFFPAKVYVDDKYANYYENKVFRLPSGEIVAIYDDVTERENAVAQIKESRERFDLAMKASKDGIYDWNLITNEIYYSPGWKSMLGYEYDELPNDFSVWEKLTEPEYVKRSWEMQQEVVNKKRDRFEMEFKMKHKAGHWVDILSRAEAIFDEDGKAVRLIGTHVDISEQKQAAAELLESEELFRSLYEHLEVGLAFISLNLVIERVNSAYCKMLGYSESELIGKHLKDITSEEDIEENLSKQKKLANGEIDHYRMEKQFIHKDGQIVYGILDANLIRGAEDEPLYFIGSVSDITNRRKNEEVIKRFSRIFEDTLNEIYLFDAEKLTFIQANQAAVKNLGYSAEELYSMTQLDIKPEFDEESFADLVKPLLDQTKKTIVFETVHQRKDKTLYFVEIHLQLLHYGNTKLFSAIVIDITERKQAQDALQESENNLRAIFKAMTDVVIEVDYNGKYIDIAPTSPNLLYKPSNEMLGKTLHDLFPKQEADRFLAFYRKSLDEQKTVYLEYALNINNTTIWFDAKAVPKTENTALLFARDITERKNAEEKLIELDQFRNGVIENANVWLNVLDRTGKVVIWNKAAESISGYSREEAIGNDKIWDLFYPDEKYRTEINAKAMAIIEKNDVLENFETTICCKDGTNRVISWNSRNLKDKNDEPIGSIALGRDVTERKRAEEELVKHREHLEELVKERTIELETKNQRLEEFNKLFVGREFRIKELRTKVKELEEKLEI